MRAALISLVCGAIVASPLLVATACGLFIGPATAPSEADWFMCGQARCRRGWEECSTGKPLACIPAYSGVARDAGADR